ncbi:glycine betaine ABC transporter substrate-binding protein [Methylobacterium brachythecii]|nr:glycine betaine ABC transporter substrate-binding protein [Methylobacterium brachythecii]GLS42144.1 ABC transporter substrate-binding protein [Methylobacterium brachythecii]
MAAVGALGLAITTPLRAQNGRPVVVASKSDTEGALTGSLIALILEGLGLTVERKLGLGPTLIVRSALLAGEVDVYPEYTGNGAFFSGTETDAVWKSGAGGYERARALDAERGLVWLKPAPANNTWLIAVRGGLARERGLRSMADFADAVRDGVITLAASTEFVESPAALPSFEAAYEFSLPASRIVSLPGGDTAVTARAAAEGISGVNAGMVYGTDGALAALDLTVMSDPKAAQIVYEVAPVIRAETLQHHPGIREALDPVFARLEANTLRRLNARITVEGETAEAVARAYLAEAGVSR